MGTELKSILLIGVGEIGLNQISWAREAGFRVIVSDVNPQAPSLKLADVAVNLSGTDTEALADWARENQDRHNIIAVYTGNDLGVAAAAAVAEALGISGPGPKAVANGLSKSRMKECWRKNGVPTPDHGEARSRQEAATLADQLGLPVVIKPHDSSGSRGIQTVRKGTELEGALEEAWQHAGDDLLLVEKAVVGRHIDGNGFFWDNEFYGCGLSERFFTPEPFRVPLGGFEPVPFSVKDAAAIYKVFEQAARSLGITAGPVKGDFILAPEGLQVIEVSPRFHGDVGTSHTTFYRTGLSHLHIYFETLFSGQVPLARLQELEKCDRVAGWRVFNLRPGKISNLEGAAGLAQKKVPGSRYFVRPRGPGTMVNLKNNTQVAGFVWVTGPDKDAVDSLLEQYLACLQAQANYLD